MDIEDIDDYLKRDLEQSVRATHPDWSEDQVRVHIALQLAKLSQTPPVEWIQNNNWPVCHGKFCDYLGEWDQGQFAKESSDGNGYSYFMSIVQEPDGIGHPKNFWASIADNWTIMFVFECSTCKKRIAIDQSF